jgi:hypothetical protein
MYSGSPTGKLLASYMNSSKIVFNTLEPLVTLRFEERERAKRGHRVPEHVCAVLLNIHTQSQLNHD